MERPGGALSSRPLHFIWLADCSGSMSTQGKIQSLNNAAREALPHMRQVAEDNPNAQVLVRVIAFSDGARWIVEEPTPVQSFVWQDLVPGGLTDLGAALDEVAARLRSPEMPARALPPVLVLLSDGHPTDDFAGAFERFMNEPWAAKAVRVSIAIGNGANRDVLQQFVGDPRIPVLTARNPDELVRYLRWASTVVLNSASSPRVAEPGRGDSRLITQPPASPVVTDDLTW
jgi:uncharacterized protein YegL